jgi:hypothetical protein
MAEESLEDKEPSMAEWKKGKRSNKRHKSEAQHSDIRRLSQPAAPANESITERGIVEKRTWEIESRSPGNSIGKGTILTKLWPAKRSSGTVSNVNASQSSKSTSPRDSLHVVDEAEDSLLSPPPLPTIEFLLGKRPAYLRGRKIIPHQDGVHNEDDEHLSDIDSDHSSVGSSQSDRTSQQKKKLKKKRRKGSKDDDDAFDRQYNQLAVPQSSPTRNRKARARKLTPIPAKSPYGPRRGIASAFDEVSRELEMASPPLSNSSLNSLSKSPQQVSPPQALKTKPLETGCFEAKQTAPLSPPQKQHTAQPMGRQAGSPPKRAAPISLMGSSRKPLPKQQPETSGSQQINPRPVAVKPSPSRPTIQQMSRPSSATSGSGVQAGVLNSSESDSESSEYSSTSDDSTSSSESSDSSDEESGFVQAQVPKRPMMARNIGMGSPRRTAGDMTRTRMMTRYPRLLNKKPIRLVTVEEVPEEIVHEAETYEDKAVLFQRLVTKRKFIRGWRKYMQIMKTIYRKAEKMAQRKRRDLVAKIFYAWIHVRNIGAVMKNDIDKAITYHDKRLMKRVFNAWYFTQFGAKMPIARSTSMQLMNAELEYIDWVNGYLPQTEAVNDISGSLADGTIILKALSVAIGKKAPKHNRHPKVQLHRQDNWKVAYEFMASAGINVKGIEPADLGNVNPAAIHNMFVNILKWEQKRAQTTIM